MDRRTLLLLALAAAMPVRARTAKPAPAPGLESVLVPAGMGVLALRVARCWVQTGVGVEGDHAMQTLTRSTRSFEQAFAGLRTIAPRVGQGEAVLLVEQRWRVPDGQLFQDFLDRSKQLNQTPATTAKLPYHAPNRHYKFIYQGLILPCLPAPLHYLNFIGLLGESEYSNAAP